MTPKLDKHQRLELLLARQRRYDGGWIKYGWEFNGPGPARFGWWRVSCAGATTFLGQTFADAEKSLTDPAYSAE